MRFFQVMRTLGATLFFLTAMLSAQSAMATHQVQVNDLTTGTQIIPSAGVIIDHEHPIGFLLPHCHSFCDAALGHPDPNPDPNGAGHGFTQLLFHSSPPPTPPPATNNLFPETGRDQVALTGGDFKVPEEFRGRRLNQIFGEGSKGDDPNWNQTTPTDPKYREKLLGNVETGSVDDLFPHSL